MPRDEDLFLGREYAGGIACYECSDRRTEEERRAHREWFDALWEDGPWWVKALLVLTVPVGFSAGMGIGMWAIGRVYMGYFEFVAHSLQQLGFGGGTAGFLAIVSPLLLFFLAFLIDVGGLFRLLRRSFRSE